MRATPEKNVDPYTDLGIGSRTLELLADAHGYNRWTFQRVGAALGQRILEVGCGTGTITQFLVDRELVVGVDVVEELLAAARDRYREYPNVLLIDQDITRSIEGLRDFRFDSALSVNVFEHIEDDVSAMRAVHSVLEPGGTFTLLVPAHRFLYGPFDSAIGHYRRYARVELQHKLQRAGFQVVSLRRSNLVGALGWLVNVRILRQDRLNAVGLYDRLVPLMAQVEALLRPPFGLSLIAVGRKV